MEKLNPQQVARIYNHLIQAGLSDTVLHELFNHLAGEVEHYMWIGLPFESALDKALLEANIEAISRRPLSGRELQEASLDDIVFQFRNKAYGAYDLRQSYNKTLRNAFIMALGLCLIGMALLQMIARGTWSYLSMWGAIWLVGLGAVTFAAFSWYLEHERQKQQYSR
ncbi:hypothetical protein HNV11_04480 [Spirosoma taeanense]|uniref:Uncharacterized protein n=1 Tax=Spirosoma taeanense TaxID=2735870 RepID=A0A6M5Y4H8_9BACT|nr:hypothetical protein [Spirosoma taeanense]QJW88685.1 hypothetical protein HNV11_04480 [Spirosoma taeanense]